MSAAHPDFDICLTCWEVRCAHSVSAPTHEFVSDYGHAMADIERASAPHSDETRTADEPEGGWVTSPTLKTEAILSVLLCKYTGEKPIGKSFSSVPQCQARVLAHHEDVECLTLFHSAAGITALLAGVSTEMAAAEVTAAHGDVTFHDPVT